MIRKTIVPDKRKVELSFNVPDNYIGAEMEVIAFVKNEALTTDDIFMRPALSGRPIEHEAFMEWVIQAESAPSISLEDAKKAWEVKRKQLQNLTK